MPPKEVKYKPLMVNTSSIYMLLLLLKGNGKKTYFGIFLDYIYIFTKRPDLASPPHSE